jgi:Flp pilus assembly protein TadD
LYVTQKQYERAEKLFREVYRPEQGDFRALQGLVEVYAAQHAWDQALAVLTQENKRFPDALPVRKLMAATAVRANRTELAIEQYGRILERQPNDLETLTALGQVYEHGEDFPKAIGTLEKACDLAPRDWQTTALLASAQQAAGKFSVAKISYQRAVSLGANDGSVLNKLAFLEAQTGSDLEKALTFAKRALATSPTNPEFADTVGYVYLQRKDSASARAVFRGLSQRYPREALFRYHLALALLAGGERASGERQLRLALAADPSLQQAGALDLPR